jgi:hypothetical protein
MPRLAYPQVVAGRFQRGQIRPFVIRIRNAQIDVDHRLGRQPGHGSRTHVVDPERHRPQSPDDPLAFAREQVRPDRAVVDDQDLALLRTTDQLRLLCHTEQYGRRGSRDRARMDPAATTDSRNCDR